MEAFVNGRGVLGLASREKELALKPMQLRNIISFTASLGLFQSLIKRRDRFGKSSETGQTLGMNAEKLRIPTRPSGSLAGVQFGSQKGRTSFELTLRDQQLPFEQSPRADPQQNV